MQFASYLINFPFSYRLLNFVAFFLLLCGDSSLAMVLTLLNLKKKCCFVPESPRDFFCRFPRCHRLPGEYNMRTFAEFLLSNNHDVAGCTWIAKKSVVHSFKRLA